MPNWFHLISRGQKFFFPIFTDFHVTRPLNSNGPLTLYYKLISPYTYVYVYRFVGWFFNLPLRFLVNKHWFKLHRLNVNRGMKLYSTQRDRITYSLAIKCKFILSCILIWWWNRQVSLFYILIRKTEKIFNTH